MLPNTAGVDLDHTSKEQSSPTTSTSLVGKTRSSRLCVVFTRWDSAYSVVCYKVTLLCIL